MNKNCTFHSICSVYSVNCSISSDLDESIVIEMSGNIDENCLIVRNFPHSYTERDIHDFLQMFDAMHVSVFIAHRTAVVEFGSKDHARDILTLLHQEAVDENRLFVEYAPKNRSHMTTLSADVNSKIPKLKSDEASSDDDNGFGIVEALKRLYATAENLNINQPPPPHLHYEYPKVNRDIIDAICIALECMPKFYNQVLHLMNRMNLEPPFVPGDKHLVYASSTANVQYTSVSTQTDEIMWQNSVRSKRKLIESDESELESNSSDEKDPDGIVDLNASHAKRKKFKSKDTSNDSNKQELLKQKQRNLLKMQRIQKQSEFIDKSTNVQTNPHTMSEAFDSPQLKLSSIKIVVPGQFDVTSQPVASDEPMSIKDGTIDDSFGSTENVNSNTLHLWSDSELKANRIPAEQLKVHPMYQSYSPGDISNRLYIKNIAKEVAESDLHAIYDRYLEMNCDGRGYIRSIDIRLMTSGRMKGQAFITFDGPYLNCDVDSEAANNLSHKYRMIEKALLETNGLILKGKPLVVVYGKKK